MGRDDGAVCARQVRLISSGLDRLDPRHVTASVPSTDPGPLPVLAHLAEAVTLACTGLDHPDGESLAAVAGSVTGT